MGAAVVTGAGRGMGLGIAHLLAGRGYSVYVTDLDAASAEQAAASVGGVAVTLDVRDDQACAALADRAVSDCGALDLWVNNAGVLLTGPAWTQDPSARRLMVEVNALGLMNGTLAALQVMRPADRGHIVNVVSLAGLFAAPGETVYCASKHAALAFSLGTLADLRLAGCRGVSISCICPDGVWTPMLHDKLDDRAAAMSFSGALLQPEQVVQAVARVLDRPRPVTVIPRWRGVQARLFDALPRVGLRVVPAGVALGRWKQYRMRRAHRA